VSFPVPDRPKLAVDAGLDTELARVDPYRIPQEES